MTRTLTAARRMAALGLSAVAVVAAPGAAPPAAAATPAADLFITVTPKDGGAYAMRLRCDPDGGTHPRPGKACDALRTVDGWVDDLDVDPGPCPMIYLPVDVEVTGNWYRRAVSYRHEFPNECVMRRTLGPVV